MSDDILVPELALDETLARKLVSEQFSLEIKSSRLLGEGFDNLVFLFNGHLVFRFPKSESASELIQAELRILPALADKLPLAIPKPAYVGTPCAAYDALFYGHEILAGKTGCELKLSSEEFQRCALSLGFFLKTLHGLSIDELRLDKNKLKALYDRVERERMLLWLNERWDVVKDVFSLAQYQELKNMIVSESACYKARIKPIVLVHGDLYHRHLLFNKHNKLEAIIDWGDSCLSDRVVDLGIAWQFLIPEARHTFWQAYGEISEEEQAYARFLGLYYVVSMLWYGFKRRDKNLINSSLFALTHI